MMKKKIFISPLPNKWHDLYQKILNFWENTLFEKCQKPPTALVLSGWTFSNDFDKKQRWEETLQWATENGALNLLIDIAESEKYYVEEMSDWRPYQYSQWNEKPRIAPTNEDCSRYLQKLKINWLNLMENEFGRETSPIGFTGKKSRRLIVIYKENYKPPWGDWNNYLANGHPSKFSELRKKVNTTIHPHEVDHIDFFPEGKKVRKLKL